MLFKEIVNLLELFIIGLHIVYCTFHHVTKIVER